MKIRITDLLDQYHDGSAMLSSSEARQTEDENEMKEIETVPVKESKHRFGWKEGLSVAAAAAVVVLGGFGVSRLLRRNKAPEAPIAFDTADTLEYSEPSQIETEDTKTSEPNPVQETDVALTPELQAKANRFLTYFAEQYISNLDVNTADAYQLVSFAHLYYKINEPDAIVYQSLNDESYETLTETQVNDLLQLLMNTSVDVPEGTDFTAERGDNYAQHEIVRDGAFWFPAADGDMHSAFAVAERITDNRDGTWSLKYRAYDLAEPGELSFEQKGALAGLTVAQADQDEQFSFVMCGCAVVRAPQAEEQDLVLRSLDASWVDPTQHPDSDDPGQTDPEGLLQDPVMRASFNSLLSRFAELGMVELRANDGDLMRFAYHYAKQCQDDRYQFTAQTRNEVNYLTMKVSDVNGILADLLVSVSIDPEDGTEFSCPIRSDYEANGFVENGVVWFPSGEDLTYPNFVICTGARTAPYEVTRTDGTASDADCFWVDFIVYETSLEDPNIRDYYQLSAAEAESLAAEKPFYLVEKGSAVILPADGGQVLFYKVTWIEPEGWEEEFPEEYPVNEYRIEGEGFLQTGEINQYRYEQLPEAEGYVDILTGIARKALEDDSLTFEQDSPHDGYANWFMTGSKGSSSVSGSSITGRFTYSLNPSFDLILAQSKLTVTDRSAMEQAAREFAEQFRGITGELTLVGSKDDDLHYHDERFTGLRDLIVPTVIYYFRSEENSRQKVAAQDGLEVPVSCGDSTIDDLTDHVFAVTVWPDGTVVRGNNYITKAEIVSDGTMEMPDERAMNTILSFMTSYVENDVFVLESAEIEEYGVYFGHGTIDPILTVKYHFASDPEGHLSTQITIPGLLD